MHRFSLWALYIRKNYILMILNYVVPIEWNIVYLYYEIYLINM